MTAQPLPRRPTVRVAVAGAGAASQVVHLPILTERRDVQVVALSDPDAHKVQAVAERFGIPRVLDDGALVSDEDVHAVVVCAPNFRHEELAVAALRAGKHVLVERPFALSAGGAKRVLEAARSSGKAVVASTAHRWQPDVGALRALVAGGRLGGVRAVQATWLNRGVRLPGSGWRRHPAESGGGALMDLGVPALDQALWVAGYPRLARVSATTFGDTDGVEDEAHLLAVTTEGAALSLAASWRFQGPRNRHQLRVMGTRGAAQLSPLAISRQVGGRPMDATPRQPIPRGREDLFTNGYRRMLDHFVRVASGHASARPPQEQAALMKLVEAAYRSARERREVRLD